MIYGFSIVHIVVPVVVLGLLLPSWFNWIIPAVIIPKGDKPVAPMETIDNTQEITRAVSEESGAAYGEQGEMKQGPPSYDKSVEPKGELK
jgi:solute carrier family 6 GABA transporter-like protein 1